MLSLRCHVFPAVEIGDCFAASSTPIMRRSLHHMSDALHQSLYRVLSLLIAILPGILAFFAALTIFTLIGMGISAMLRRGLAWLKADERFARTRLAGGLDAVELAHRACGAELLLGLRPAGPGGRGFGF